jgi:hypothetical protein
LWLIKVWFSASTFVVKIATFDMHLLESAPFNKGKTNAYAGVPGNLVAFACKLAFQRGHEGNVSFFSKTQLVQHYIDTLGASNVSFKQGQKKTECGE